MMRFIKIIFCGLLISFLGSIPLGTLNVVITYISVSNGIYPALMFAFGCIIPEILYVRIALVSMNWIRTRRKLFRFFEWLTILLIIALAIYSFFEAVNMKGFTSAFIYNIKFPFWMGVFLSVTNPLHIAFWFSWSTILITNQILLPENKYYNTYIIGIAIGSLLGFLIFIYAGNYLMGKVIKNMNVINWIIGWVLILTALIQIYKMYPQSLNYRAIPKH